MWTVLALQDIKLRYRGSVLGPWWLTITTLGMAVLAFVGWFPGDGLPSPLLHNDMDRVSADI